MTAVKIIIIILLFFAAFLGIAAAIKKGPSRYQDRPDEKNPMEGQDVVFKPDDGLPENADGVRGCLVSVGERKPRRGAYERYIKRGADILCSFFALVLLSPFLAAIALAIVIDDPGPVFFSQKRVGYNKGYFKLHKFRSMKMSTPHDVPTHMLKNPDEYITKVGRFLRAHSLDELPQIWDIFIGNMALIGPRPALWNQDLLVAEREKWGANDLRPGLSGWAQINGRDELLIPEKAALDGEYARILKAGGMKAFAFDIRCLLGTAFSAFRGDGVVEGGTGAPGQQPEDDK